MGFLPARALSRSRDKTDKRGELGKARSYNTALARARGTTRLKNNKERERGCERGGEKKTCQDIKESEYQGPHYSANEQQHRGTHAQDPLSPRETSSPLSRAPSEREARACPTFGFDNEK